MGKKHKDKSKPKPTQKGRRIENWDGTWVEIDPDTGEAFELFEEGSDETLHADTAWWDHVKCSHKGEVVVFEKDKIKLVGGTAASLYGHEADLIIDLCGDVKIPDNKTFVVHAPGEWLALNKYTIKTAEVFRFLWPDGTAPPVTYGFWENVWTLLKQRFPNGGRVCFCCVGGHGRTGTALASMIIAGSSLPLDVIVLDKLRDKYCDSVIESSGQVKYLYAIEKVRNIALKAAGKRVTESIRKIRPRYLLAPLMNQSSETKGPAGYTWQCEHKLSNGIRCQETKNLSWYKGEDGISKWTCQLCKDHFEKAKAGK